MIAITGCTILFCAMLSSCGKKIEKVSSDYIGNWTGWDGGSQYTLVIKDGAKDSWSKCEGILSCTTNTGTARQKGDNLKIGTKELHIDSAPTLAGPTWTLKLDGIVYTKQ